MPPLPATVLVLHADMTLTVLLTAVLHDEGYPVEAARTPLEALALVTRHTDRYGLILADLALETHADPVPWLTDLRAATAAALLLCGPWPAGLEASRRTPGHPPLLPTPLDLAQLRLAVVSLCPLWPSEQATMKEGADQPGVA